MVTIEQAINDLNCSELISTNPDYNICTTSDELIVLLENLQDYRRKNAQVETLKHFFEKFKETVIENIIKNPDESIYAMAENLICKKYDNFIFLSIRFTNSDMQTIDITVMNSNSETLFNSSFDKYRTDRNDCINIPVYTNVPISKFIYETLDIEITPIHNS